MRGWTVSITIQEAGRTVLSETALTLPARLIRDGDSGAVALIDGAGTAHPLAQSRFDVSRQHMTLSTEADGTLLIADQSTNGVFVSQQNSARLIGKGNTMAIPAQLQVALDTVGFDIRVQTATCTPKSALATNCTAWRWTAHRWWWRMARFRTALAMTVTAIYRASSRPLATAVRW